MKQQMALAAKLQSGSLSADEKAALIQEQAALNKEMDQEKQASASAVQQLKQQVASIESQVASEVRTYARRCCCWVAVAVGRAGLLLPLGKRRIADR